ncbi:MAG: ABC transporter permease [Sedimentisphaerales bacterium]|nr:ABC transporter permease [Sedimentisphaerales bacterium]
METLWQDIRHAFRMLARNPGFAIVVVVILSLGIGANTAVFSVVNAVLFKRLPYEQPDRIVVLQEQKLQQGLRGIASSHHTLVYWREHNQVFEGLSGVEGHRFYVTGPEKSQHLIAFAVSPGYFSVMGAKPMLGREFLAEEEQPGHGKVVMLSYAFWREQMGGDPEVIGKSLLMDGQSYTIVGVMPAAFRDHLRRCAPCWVPLTLDPTHRGGGTRIRARLKPGVTLAQAQAHMDVLEQQFVQAEPEDKAGYTVAVRRFLDEQVGDSRALLYLLWGGVGLLLLIACTNASSLFLIQSSGRRQEIAVRSALGASRGRIVRHMLMEGIVLSLAAGVIGTLLAYLAIRVLVRVSPAHIPRMQETHVDIAVLGFVFGVSVVTGLALSLLPAWKATGVHLSDVLKQGRGGLLHGRDRRLAHGCLVVIQIAVASTLLMAVAMLTQSLIAMQEVDLGFQPANVLVAQIELPKMRYPESSDWLSFYEQLLRRVQAAPGVQSAALASGGLDLAGGGGFMTFSIDGHPPLDPREKPMARHEDVSGDFFKTMGIPILEGRGFTPEDTSGGAPGIIIDENLARKYFPQGSPLGQRIDGMPIVGVASTLRDYDELSPTINTIYQPISRYCYLISDLVVRTQGDPVRLADMVRAQAAALDKDLEIREIRTLLSDLAEMLAPRRYTTILLGLFAQVALILAAVGLFGLLRYTVAQRTQEIGIRMALGATRADISRTFLRRSARLILLGVLIGLLGGWLAGRLMTSLLYEASPTDPAMLVVTLCILVTTALLASYLPARRAARIDPMVALRYE